MIVALTFFAVLLNAYAVEGVDMNSLLGRRNCYKCAPQSCNETFLEANPHLSKAASGLTTADTWFWWFCGNYTEEPECLHKCAGRLYPNTSCSSCKKLVVVVNPFIVGICDIAAYRQWIIQILKRPGYCVLVVDYSWGNHFDYGTATENIKIVANQTVIVLENIQKQIGITKDQISIVGHSLGAHLAGQIGRMFPVNRITGLDPANLAYTTPRNSSHCSQEDSLRQSDADLVDVWHVNMGDCLPDMGINCDVGDVNFYINGGKIQRVCHRFALEAIFNRDYVYGFGTLVYPNLCWHAFVAIYYKVSINPGNCQFVGVKCDSCKDFNLGTCRKCGPNGENCLIMGFDTDKYVKGNESTPQRYYLTTVDECPYCDNCDIDMEGFASTYVSSLQTTEGTQSSTFCTKGSRCIEF